MRAILTAFSTASAPVVTKNVFFFDEPGASLFKRSAKLDVAFVHCDLEARVRKALELFGDGLAHFGMRVADICHADPANKIDVFLAVDIPELRTERAGAKIGCVFPTPRGISDVRKSSSAFVCDAAMAMIYLSKRWGE